MKYIWVAGSLLVLIACSGKRQEPDISVLQTFEDSVSYSIGMEIGRGFRNDAIEIDPAVYQKGFMDGYFDRVVLINEDERRETVIAYRREHSVKKQEREKRIREDNIAAGRAFLSENAEKEGVISLPSGLQYKVLIAGTGATPTTSDRVNVHYRGRLLDGTEFDSSYERGQPATFLVTGVIKGWIEALQLMPVGAKWELYISPDLAYGPMGQGTTIPPMATLIFEVELLGIE
ncbi:MAG: FKBP-type peptidyl-prolyl cis-trans isomerase [Candidatus Marinimicrobia bacterium]|nr:FKBP-type peptidyl-prolyl cis-trans isomerase [Candidatus Neomarinimicrobiota bacterium]